MKKVGTLYLKTGAHSGPWVEIYILLQHHVSVHATYKCPITLLVGNVAQFVKCLHLHFLLEPEIATPPLLGTILDGVVRKSALDLARTWVCSL